jgi:hypothetical protein
MNNLTIENEPYLSQPTIWDALLDRDYSQLEYINKQMGWVTTRVFFKDATIAGARYQRMNYIIYPFDPDQSIELTTGPSPKPALLETLTDVPSNHSLSNLLNDSFPSQNTVIPVLNPVFENGYYIFTDKFYTNASGKSLLETLAIRYLKNESLDLALIMRVVKNYNQWSRLDQFYLSPVIWIFLKTLLGDISP